MTEKIIITPENQGSRIGRILRELFHYRELAIVLIGRDIKVRYKQTFIGIAWAFIQPFMTMVVFTLFFGKLAQIPSDGVPYPLFSFAAILPWQYFSRSMTEGAGALLTNAGIITKVYFPREILPISTVVAGLVDFFIGIIFLIILMIFFGYFPTLRMLWCVPLILLAVLLAMAFAFWVSSAAAIYRDIGFIVPFCVQLLMFATPVIYPVSIIPEKYQFFYQLNPMVLVIDGFRWAVLGSGQAPNIMQVGVSVVIVAVFLSTGIVYFNKAARLVADKI